MEANIKELEELLSSLQIPMEDCDSYIKKLQTLGYNDVVSLVETISLNELTYIMKSEHVKRVETLLKARRGIETHKFGKDAITIVI